jgi:sugar phosphate isomerase/epimerase
MKIGFRIPGKAREIPFEELCSWAAETGFGSIDLGGPNAEQVQTARNAGLEIGTVDLPVPALRQTLTSDPEKQRTGTETVKKAIDDAAALGCNRMFFVLLPEDNAQKRADTFAIFKDTFPAIASHAEAKGVRLALEGWPGPSPTYPAIGCTPEMWRAMFAAVPSSTFGLNYDPSHLVRIGIDYRRALDEFGDRIIHVHGKDTDFDAERTYEHGTLGPTFRKAVGFSESWWRYTIPGEGLVDWSRVVGRLEDFGFNGVVSVELEDYRYNDTWELQADGLRRSQQHLSRWVR